MLRQSRTDRTILGDWWLTIDKTLLATCILLIFSGLLVSLAASPDVATRINADPLFFVERHMMFVIPSIALLLYVSMQKPRRIRRLSLLIFVLAILGMVFALWAGQEVKGARRWVQVMGYTVQPSEFLKPSLIIVSAWLFSQTQQRSDVPALEISAGLFIASVILLILQPDYGQTMLLAAVWGALLFVAGVSLYFVFSVILVGAGGIWYGYTYAPHVAKRIQAFLYPESRDNFQMEKSMESFLSGGWMGRGPGEGVVKKVLPDAHSDFVFAVIGEEYGIIIAMGLVFILLFIFVRLLRHALMEPDRFRRLTIVGLAMLFSLQALIHIYVSLGLLPAKGMTLPLFSYGGSSLLSSGFLLGVLLALTRRRPRGLLRQARLG